MLILSLGRPQPFQRVGCSFSSILEDILLLGLPMLRALCSGSLISPHNMFSPYMVFYRCQAVCLPLYGVKGCHERAPTPSLGE